MKTYVYIDAFNLYFGCIKNTPYKWLDLSRLGSIPLGEGYRLYAVYECTTPRPRPVRVQDPFGRLLAKAKGSVLLSAKQVVKLATG